MKKIAIIIAMVLIFSTLPISVYAMGGGMGGGMSGEMGGNGMNNNFGSALLDWLQKWRTGSGYATPPGQGRQQMNELDKQHDEDSAYLKYQIQMKEKELDALLEAADPDIDKVRALRKDIGELRSLADREQRDYELEAGKMNPIYRSRGSDDGYSYSSPGQQGSGNMGYGGGMGGMGRH